jgi:anti-anti-sigma factor
MPETIPEAVVVVTEAFEGGNAGRWGGLIAQAVELAPRRLVVDLSASPVIDAAAIAILLRAHRAMVHAGGGLTLRGPAMRVRRILRLARLDQVFDIEGGQPATPVGA